MYMKTNRMVFPVYTQVGLKPVTICEVIDAKAFKFPFFNEGVLTLKDWTIDGKKYYLRELKTSAESELLEVKGFIFQTSHCGSTLLSRMLNESPEIRVASKTEAINGLLLSYVLCGLKEEEVLEQLSSIINAYRQSIVKEKYLMFKFTSWNIFMADLFQKLYPFVKWLYIDRKREEVVNSLQKSDGGMESWYEQPVDILRRYFLSKDFTGISKEDYLFDLVEQHRKQAQKFKNNKLYSLMYPEFLGEFESNILPHFDLHYSDQEIGKMKKIAALNSKSYKNEPYLHIRED